MHDDEVTVSLEAVRALVDEQFPAWRGLRLRPLPAVGTVNAVVRIGEELAARFPLRLQHADALRVTLQREADAATRVAAVSPVPVPLPVAIGLPGHGYPMPWSVQRWLPGRTAAEADVAGETALAVDLARLVTALRAADTRGERFDGTGRGGDLRAHDAWVEDCFARSGALLDVPRLRAVWHRLRDLPRVDPDAMTHGDLIPANLLVAGGRLTGVLDVGGFGPADPALDLVVAWHAFEDAPRAAFREALDSSDLEWDRGKAWAFQQALGLVEYYLDSNPAMSALGSTTLRRLLADER